MSAREPTSLSTHFAAFAQTVAERLELDVGLVQHVHRILQPLVRLQSFRRGEILLPMGTRCQSAWLVLDGIARHWLVTPKGEEVTLRFTPESFWAGCLEDMLGGLRGMVSTTGISAATTLIVATGGSHELFDAVSKDRTGARYIEALSRYNLKVRGERERELVTLDAAERLEKFSNDHPSVVARLTGRDLAGYLGITPQYLSQLRSAIRSTAPTALALPGP